MKIFNKKPKFNPYRFASIDNVGQEAVVSFAKLKDLQNNPFLPKTILQNNPLIPLLNSEITYVNTFHSKIKQGLHYVTDFDNNIKAYAYFIDDKAVQVPVYVDLFLKVILNDFKGFCQLIENNAPDLNIFTPDELLRGKKGYKYSLVEEMLLIGKDERLQFFKFILDKNVDISNFNIFNPASKKNRIQDILRIALEYDNIKSARYFMQKFKISLSDIHKAVINEKEKEMLKIQQSLKKINQSLF